ncbi:MAG: efflux RND transporter periplasmic adaptor subunit [Planctomycetes bacterium]|nr:efflux RND transporter periplasmic adaptor subunit [Planctomycetota bacterium]
MLKARALLFLLCLLVLSACGNDEKKAAAPAALKVRLTAVSVDTVEEAAEFSATLTAKETVEVRAKINGYLREQLFTEGVEVQEGALLYKLDDRTLQTALETAIAGRAKAEATWKNAESTKARYIPLAATGAVSIQDRDEKVTKAAESLALYNSAKAQEERAAVDLSYASITAPITGYINRSAVDVGAYISAGSTLLTTMYRTDSIRAEFAVTDREFLHYTKIKLDRGEEPKSLRFRLTLGDDRTLYGHEGVMEMADPVLDPKTNTMGVRAIFPNPDNVLRPGMYARVTAVLGAREMATVPEAAILDLAGGKAVFMVDASGVLVAVPVEIGDVRDGRRVIRKGLSPGQRIVIEGLVQAQPGMRVEVVGEPVQPASPGATPR